MNPFASAHPTGLLQPAGATNAFPFCCWVVFIVGLLHELMFLLGSIGMAVLPTDNPIAGMEFA